ncbi:ribonucleoside-diphosphate reductase, alpha subunit [Enterococcus sp. DIV0418]|uniref:class 1b ribonucleoside-diphosphate reductase subunit alpha n=1 Tax=Enterococcus TaxID=1350 RepID=UPI0013D064C3|nr:class 1b ribonucleoside-diphosphate reductase subunit alpha [Enterococcus faecalis]MBD9891195.1 class 1b ribonucleoside-diphosphate reductase subunit alpha [Enterococcus faecalis]NFA64800.1 class 1b ribonucleoside-diphosphate reductase subunit alpha [Enterococcus faecalis]NFA95309.1 class 1b ribonucleoside-diphosphate reductase subunit alpha [Enterococcus faecalis]HCT8104455.1 class 1b ribonucleoside-diphosphate reductase subunit alpha [Enterococcus faecalis]
MTKTDISKNYFYLNNLLNIPIKGKIPLYFDKQALDSYIKTEVKPNTKYFSTLSEKLNFLVKQDYIEEQLLNLYSEKFLNNLYEYLKKQKFKFHSFMGAYKFYTQYALKTNDNKQFLENFIDRVFFNSLYLGNGDEHLAKMIAEELINQRYQPATPTFLNAGKKRRGELVSCFLIDVNDSMLSIGRMLNSALQLSRIGGGVGVNLSNIRAAGDPIKKISNASSGIIPVMKLLEDSFSYSNQLGQRNGAGVAYLNVFHPDIQSFLSTKKENADEKIRIKTLSLGLIVPDKYYELLKTNQQMALFSPYDVERIYNKPFSYVDISAEYESLIDNPKIKKTYINARELEQKISKLQQESGYPYIINIDTANKTNPVSGKIIMSNLCSEILQPQTPSILNDDLSYEIVGSDISCNLGSLNIDKLIHSPNFSQSIEIAVRALTTVTDNTSIDEVPSISLGNSLYHTIGLGAMGLHTALAKNKIYYGSKEALEFTEAFFIALNYYSLLASNKIAQERRKVFHDFEKSKYADGSYFDTYISTPFVLQNNKVKKIFKHIKLPTVEDWKDLKLSIMKYGLYHRNRLAIAPNGSISYINETSASIHPITQLVEQRQETKVGSIFYPAPCLNEDTLPYYISAYDIDQRKIIDTYAVAQKHIDQGMSLTLFMRSVLPKGLYEWKEEGNELMTTRDLNRLRNYAWTKGIKSLYYVRTFTEDDEISSSNECDACMI